MVRYISYLILILVLFTFVAIFFKEKPKQENRIGKNEISLPQPLYKSQTSLEEALLSRKSIREYKQEPISLEELSQLLWAAQGMTREWGGRTAPSAGGIYPIQVYVVVKNVDDVERGVYLYDAKNHSLILLSKGDFSKSLMSAVLNQRWIGDAALNFVITGNYNKTVSKYGERGIMYVHLEAGHVSQNIYLQAAALNLGTVAVGAFDDEEVRKIIHVDKEETPLYVMPVGRPA